MSSLHTPPIRSIGEGVTFLIRHSSGIGNGGAGKKKSFRPTRRFDTDRLVGRFRFKHASAQSSSKRPSARRRRNRGRPRRRGTPDLRCRGGGGRSQQGWPTSLLLQ